MRTLTTAAWIAGILLTATAASAEFEDLTDGELRAREQRAVRELATLHDHETKLARAERQSSNTARAAVIDALQEHMIDVVMRREDELGVEHTIIRHGQPPTGPTAAAEVGAPKSNKETRRRIARGTSQKSDAFLRLHNMQIQVSSGERIYRQAIERQNGALDTYRTLVAAFGAELDAELKGLREEIARREPPAPADSTAVVE